jgi:hypothetical protein
MSLKLHILGDDFYFSDAELGGAQVGQTYRKRSEGWTVEVNDEWLEAPDLEAAIRLFLKNYDQTKVHLSPGSSFDGDSSEYDFGLELDLPT